MSPAPPTRVEAQERVEAALARAHEDAARPAAAAADGARRARTLAVGDPQAPLETFLSVLAAHDALGDDGRLRADTALISAGDHFDWGTRAERARAAEDGTALLAWLAAHPADQVVILLGNHDLARVGELSGVDDAAFVRAQAVADGIDKTDVEGNAAFRAEHGFFSAEVVNRDFCSFRTAQRDLVEMLLRARRLKLAHARGDMLFVHAGITLREIDAVGIDLPTPATIADALNYALDEAVERRAAGPLIIDGVHQPGDAQREGFGALYHRPAQGITEEQKREGRRFDPRALPRGIVQVIGHIRDKKCRDLLGDWCDDGAHALGVLRHMSVDDAGGVRYARGLPERFDPRAAHVVFLDGGMNDMRDRPEAYEVLDVERRAAADLRRG